VAGASVIPVEDRQPGRPVTLVEHFVDTPMQVGQVVLPASMPWQGEPRVCVIVRAYLATGEITLALGALA